MEKFIDKGDSMDVLAVLNYVRVYMEVVVLNEMITKQGTKISKWAIRGEVNRHHIWV